MSLNLPKDLYSVTPESRIRGPLTDSVFYLYNYYMLYILFFHAYHVTPSCDITLTCDCDV